MNLYLLDKNGGGGFNAYPPKVDSLPVVFWEPFPKTILANILDLGQCVGVILLCFYLCAP